MALILKHHLLLSYYWKAYLGCQALFSIQLEAVIKWRDYRLVHASPGSQELSPNPREAQKHTHTRYDQGHFLLHLFKNDNR